MDYRKLKGRICEKYGTQQEFAAAYGTSSAVMSMMLNTGKPLPSKNIIKFAALLDIPTEDIGVYFFTI